MGSLRAVDGSTHWTFSVREISSSQPSLFVHILIPHLIFLSLSLLDCCSCTIFSVTTIEGWLIYSTNWDRVIEAASRRNECA